MNPQAVQMALSRRTTALLHLLILFAAAGFALSRQSPTPIVLLGAASLVAWLLVESPVAGKAIVPPTWTLNVVVLIGAGFLWHELSQEFRTGNQNVIIALTHFILVLLACKLF